MVEGENSNGGKPPPRIGSYHLIQPLGTGGMSSVFKAVHVETGHAVAVKVLPRALAKNTTLLQRFLREARSAESLEHPNIVSIYDRGVDQGRHYLVLEFVEGGDLHDRVRNGGPLGLGEAIAAIRSIATGLQFAASRGLIHRDIKPANLLMTPSKEIKIIDLGLALQAENEDERVTREGTTVGTVDYMSPEQARDSRATSERSDIYSLGCTFYFLLTGSPPFPGGDISDKLSRHCLEAAPNPRVLRPEIPASLALLIRRMMAKRPENRFANYQELIESLDSLPIRDERTAQGEGAGEPQLARFADDDDDAPGLLPILDSPAEPLFALIDEDDDEPTELPPEMIELIEPDHNAPPGTIAPSERAVARLEVSLAELAELAPLDDPEPPDLAVRRPVRSEERDQSQSPGFLAHALLEEDLDVHFDPSLSLAGSRKYNDPIAKIVLTYSLIGLALFVLIIGVHQLYRASRPAPELLADPGESDEGPRAPELVEPTIVRPQPPPPPRATVSDEPRPVAKRPTTAPPAAVSWAEPDDPVASPLPEIDFGRERESQFVPAWARAEVPSRLIGNFVTVRRVGEPKDPAQKHALRLALETIGGTVELADDGPFFEDDLRIRGESLLIRARDGFRPIVCIEPPQLDVVREQPAVFFLDGKNLVLDGLDLVVDVSQLPQTQSSLFWCKGGILTLRRCTVTIVNPRRRSFALVRSSAAESPARIRLEETMVRGTAFTAVDLDGGSADVVFQRSVVVSGGSPLLRSSAMDLGAERTIQLVRSLLCSRGPLLELAGNAPPQGSGPLAFRVLGTTIAQLAGEGTTSLIVSAMAAGRPDERVNWVGHRGVFAGWHDWFSLNGGRTVKVTNLSSARTVWPGLDGGSREDHSRWQIEADLERVTPGRLLSIAADCGGTLSRVASPSPFLLEKTIESFPRPELPPLAVRGPTPVAPKVAPVSARSAAADLAAPGPKPDEAQAQGVRELKFNLSAGPWHGDLGLFLRDQIQKQDRRLRVLIVGSGAFFTTPIRLPEGVSLELEPDRSSTPSSPPIIWSAVRGATSEALIDVRGGDLVLGKIRLTRDGTARLKHLVRVEGGNLVLSRCWLTAPGAVERDGGDLISFQATSTEPRPPARGRGPFQTPVDRPVCRLLDTLLMTGGNAIRAEVGRGEIALIGCALAVGKSAFDLRPAKVARSRFEAGLSIDHCTIASEGSFVNLGSWPGGAPGPDRPWLVASRDSAFLASYDRSGVSTESVLLRVEPDSLDRGALFWQSANDAFDVVHFTARAGLPLSTPLRPDVHRLWVKLWGESHIHGATGPIWPRGSMVSTPSVRFYERLPSGKVMPPDLELDRKYHPGRTRMNVGADLTRLQIPLRKRDRH